MRPKKDPRKAYARHHALDIYRVVGLLTRDEFKKVLGLSKEFKDDPKVLEVKQVIREKFLSMDSEGCIRMQEHSLYNSDFDLESFIETLAEVFDLSESTGPA